MSAKFFDNLKNGVFKIEVCIALGTVSVLIYVKGRGIVLREPSVVIVDKDTETIVKVGEEARKVLGRTPEGQEVVRPLRGGVINRYNVTQQMVQHYIKKACGNAMVKPKVVVCIPSCATDVDELAVFDAINQSGSRQTFLVEEPIAAALGAGLDISEPKGKMVVDIGGGTSDIAVIALDGIVVSESIKIAGDAFDEAIMRYVREKHELVIGYDTAEHIKRKIGSLSQSKGENKKLNVTGRCIKTRLPKTVTLTSSEMLGALYQPVTAIIEAISRVIMSTPPELVRDIVSTGIVMTGGGSLIPGLDKLVERITGIRTEVAPNALTCVTAGMGKLLDMMADGKDVSVSLLREHRNRN
jgi:rod shape-determining protein MreB